MNAVVFEHVHLAELPLAWRTKLTQAAFEQMAEVTVRIEQEASPTARTAENFKTDDPAFGIWRDRDDMTDAAAYARTLRMPRYERDGSRNQE